MSCPDGSSTGIARRHIAIKRTFQAGIFEVNFQRASKPRPAIQQPASINHVPTA